VPDPRPRFRSLLQRLTGASASNRKITRNFIIGFFGSGMLGLLTLARLAVLTKSMSEVDYGLIVIVISLFSFVVGLVNVRVQDVIFRMQPVFETREDNAAIAGLIYSSLALCLLVGGAVSVAALLAADVLAVWLYDRPELALAFRCYAPAAVFVPLISFATAILRLRDKFLRLVLAQAAAQGLMVAALLIYFLRVETYQLTHVVLILAGGEVVFAMLPVTLALHAMRHVLQHHGPVSGWRALMREGRDFWSTLFHTNVTGYLQLATDPGDQFFLGAFASPSQVAIYGVARRLAQPAIVLVKRNLNAAIMPNIVELHAREQWVELDRLVIGYTKKMLVIGAVLTGVLLAVLLPLLPILTRPEYVASRPILAILLVAVFLQVTFLPGYPLCIAMNAIGRRNLGLLAGALVLVPMILTGLTALKTALTILATFVIIDVFVYLPLYVKLRRMARAQQASAPDPPDADASAPNDHSDTT